VTRLNRVVSGVLDFARPISFEIATADLHEICRNAAQAAAASGDDIPIDLAMARGPAVVVTDAERLRSVLVNVLGNALQAVRARTGDCPSPPLVRLRTARTADARWRIEIEDRGVGIEPDDLPHIFDPFFTTRRGGSGLGLAIARNIVEGLGGSIGVESRVRAGTTVRIDLPARSAGTEGHA
jgi:signal transduction histidine kinase